mgnify:FL=1
MEYRKIYIENFGKIKSAEVEIAPFMLFVGDNNSGKSYLTSLIWGLQNYGRTGFFSAKNMKKSQHYSKVFEWISDNIRNAVNEQYNVKLKEYGVNIQSLINDCLDFEKKSFVKWLFNTDEVSIDKIQVEIPDLESVEVDFHTIQNKKVLESDGDTTERVEIIMQVIQHKKRSRAVCLASSFDEIYDKHNIDFLMSVLCYSILGMNYAKDTSIYLPASRTGFMLTKDIINQVGRDNTFNDNQESAVTPFTYSY